MNDKQSQPADEPGMIQFMRDVSVYCRAFRLNDKHKYRSMEDFFIHTGRIFPKRSDADLTKLKGEPNRCFNNASNLVLHNPDRYIYCEGFASVSFIPIHHAWVCNHQGEVLELTTETPAETYVGIAVRFGYLMQRMYRTNYNALFTGLPDFDAEVIKDPVSKWKHPVMRKLTRINNDGLRERVEELGKSFAIGKGVVAQEPSVPAASG